MHGGGRGSKRQSKKYIYIHVCNVFAMSFGLHRNVYNLWPTYIPFILEGWRSNIGEGETGRSKEER